MLASLKTFPERLRTLAWRKHLPLILTFAGILMLGYVGGEYYAMYREQKMLTQEWEKQNAPNAAAEKSAKEDGLIRVVIPKIDLDAIVLEGAGRKQLKLGPGRIKSSALPGEPGNSVITAHRDTFFRRVYELKKGDELIIRRKGEVFKFEVSGYKIVKPDDLSVLKQTKDSQLTLITCYPTYFIGPAPERLVVFSKLVERAPDGPHSASASTPNSAP